ncbi:MAG: hypothetical protein N3C12_02000 [Candidatus Binatia bacterium]|nr:hypothetical protein [Candidatus Binatia bacterium]
MVQTLQNHKGLSKSLVALTAVSFWLLTICGCGPEEPPGFKEPAPHVDILVGSSQVNAKQLAAWFNFDVEISLPCQQLGDFHLCTASEPGFADLELRSGGYEPLTKPVPLALEIVSNDQGIQVKSDEAVAAAPGDRIPLGESGSLHAHVEWFFVGTERASTLTISFRLVELAENPSHEPSPPYTLTFRLQ